MKSILSAVIGATLSLAALHASADERPGERQVAFVIESHTLAEALDQWAQQSGYQILVTNWDVAKELDAPQLRGKFIARAALEQLLDGSPLTYDWLSDNLVTIRARNEVGSLYSGRPVDGSVRQRSSMPASEFAGEGFGGYAVAATDERGGTASRTDGVSPGNAPGHTESVEEVIVTGSYIRGATPVGSPLLTFSRIEIEKMGAQTVEQFLRKVPQNVASVDDQTFLNQGNAGAVEGTSNFNRGSTVNLHGIGAGATLVLINGHRLAPAGSAGAFIDVSMIPLSAVERVEIISDGASAIYGSDAVAGVVNFILRDDFQGSETSIDYARTTQAGFDQFRAAQMLGVDSAAGNALLIYEHLGQSALEAADRDFIPDIGGRLDVLPKQTRDSALLTAKHSFSDATSIEADGFYSKRDFDQRYVDAFGTDNQEEGTASQYAISATLKQELGADWAASFIGSQARTLQENSLDSGGFLFQQHWRSDVLSGELRADGSVFEIVGGQAKLSIGAGVREEKFLANSDVDLDRLVYSAHSELLLPLIGAANRQTWANSLQVSLAARFDHYDDIGGSVDPKIGIAWEPVRGLSFRGSFTRAYRAPLLSELDPTQSFFTAGFPDPEADDGETMSIVTATSQNPALKPERSKSYTAGFDLQPEQWKDFSLAVTYFNLTFEDRISTPPIVGGAFNLFFQRDVLASFINENPDIAEVERIFAEPLFFNEIGVSPVDIEAIVDLRPHNIGLTETSGLDVQVRKQIGMTFGEIGLFADGSWLFDLKTQPLPTAREVDLLNRAFNPIDLRVRTGASLSKGPWSASIALNYTDSYVNDLVAPRAAVDSWITADLYLGFQSANTTIGLNVQNLADEDPPRLTGIGDSFLPNLGYDGVNASALGRSVSVSLRKKW